MPFIATDIIVGFKGETDAEFADAVENLKEIEFSSMHIFPYSERSGTVASKLKGDVDKCTVKNREAVLQALNAEFKTKFLTSNIGTEHRVLIEEIVDGVSLGYTENYIYSYIQGEHQVGDIVTVKLTELFKDGMKAEILN